jgi:rhodanese-related sulfurtransferase
MMRWRRWLAGAAAMAGALAPIAGSPYRTATDRPSGAFAGSRTGWLAAVRPGSAAVPSTGSPTVLSAGAVAASPAELAAALHAGQPAAPSGAAAVSPAGARVTSRSGSPAGTPIRSIDVAELARAVADQQDHVSAVELAAWIRARRPGLRVIDVRTEGEYRAFHIPGAEHLGLADLAHARFGPDDTVVLYSEVGVHGAQAWVFLRALGHRHVYFLRDGLHEWLDDVMSPTIAADAPAEALAAFETVAELSRWFGGTPRWIDRSAAAAPEAPVRRRGC